MNKKSLGSYLALHRRGYLLASLWAALWAGLLAGFFWYFRFDALALTKGDPAFDAMMQMPVSENIRITRYAAVYLLMPLSAMIAAGSVIIADTLLFLFNLDRNRIWFLAIKWSFRDWKALLVWLAAFIAIYMAAALIERDYIFLISAALGISLLLVLPFVVLNKDNVVSARAKNFTRPKWPGSQPVLLAATFIAVAAPISVFYDKFLETQLNPALIFLFDRLQDLILAIVALVLSCFWINRYKKFNLGKFISWKNVGAYLSLNIMSGLWLVLVLAPPLLFILVVEFFLLPSILLANRESFEIYSMLSGASQSFGWISAYWWIALMPLIWWMLIHAYGRLVFLLGLIEDNDSPQTRH